MHLIRLLICLITLVQNHHSFAQEAALLAIIIDDLGNSQSDFQAFKLPIEVTFSLIPFTPHATHIAQQAHQQGRTILAHIPMQAKKDNHKLGKGALMLDMSEAQFKDQLTQSLCYFPDAQGINNHMGSTLTEQVIPMRWTMEVLQVRGLYFVDSRTTVNTIAQETANAFGIPSLRRHVFLDNIKTEHAMEQQFQHAIKLTKRHNAVIIIAHPYPETINFLYKKLSQKTSNEFTLTALNQLIPEMQRLALLQKQRLFATIN